MIKGVVFKDLDKLMKFISDSSMSDDEKKQSLTLCSYIRANIEDSDDDTSVPEQAEGLAEAIAGGLKDSTDVHNIVGACRDFGCEQLDGLADLLKGGLY